MTDGEQFLKAYLDYHKGIPLDQKLPDRSAETHKLVTSMLEACFGEIPKDVSEDSFVQISVILAEVSMSLASIAAVVLAKGDIKLGEGAVKTVAKMMNEQFGLHAALAFKIAYEVSHD